MSKRPESTTRRKVWVLDGYYDEAGAEHTRRLPGVRFGRAGFGRVHVMYRDIDGVVRRGRRRPHLLRSRDG